MQNVGHWPLAELRLLSRIPARKSPAPEYFVWFVVVGMRHSIGRRNVTTGRARRDQIGFGEP
jgi:hypothetical protein